MAESFSKMASEVDPRSATFVQRGVRGVDPLDSAEGLVKAGVNIQQNRVKAAGELADRQALSEFALARGELAQETATIQGRINSTLQEIQSASTEKDFSKVKVLTKQLQKLENAPNGSVSAQGARRRALISQFAANHPHLAADGKRIADMISGTSSGIVKSEGMLAAQQREAMAALSKTAFEQGVTESFLIDLGQTQAEEKRVTAKRNLALAKNAPNFSTAFTQASRTAGDKAFDGIQWLNSAITAGQIDLDDGLPPIVVDSIREEFKGLNAQDALRVKRHMMRTWQTSAERVDYINALSSSYGKDEVATLIKEADDTYDSQVTSIINSNDLSKTLESYKSITESKALYSSIARMAPWARDLALVNKDFYLKYTTEILPVAMATWVNVGQNTAALETAMQAAIKSNNASDIANLQMTLNVIKGDDYVNNLMEDMLRISKGEPTGSAKIPKGNPQLDQANAPMLSKLLHLMGEEGEGQSVEVSQTIVDQLIQQGAGGNTSVLSNLNSPESVAIFKNNPKLWEFGNRALQRNAVAAEDNIIGDMSSEGMQFSFNSPAQASSVQVSKIRGKQVIPAEAFTASSPNQFGNQSASRHAKYLNQMYLTKRQVEGQAAADKWANTYIEEVNTKSAKLRLTWLVTKQASIVGAPEQEAQLQAEMDSISSNYPDVATEVLGERDKQLTERDAKNAKRAVIRKSRDTQYSQNRRSLISLRSSIYANTPSIKNKIAKIEAEQDSLMRTLLASTTEPVFIAPEVQEDEQDFGSRPDGTKKGTGFLGVLERPDGSVSTEISIGVNLNGKETDIPLLVPTLTQDEIDSLLAGDRASESIVQKAVDHARKRIEKGQSPFAD